VSTFRAVVVFIIPSPEARQAGFKIRFAIALLYPAVVKERALQASSYHTVSKKTLRERYEMGQKSPRHLLVLLPERVSPVGCFWLSTPVPPHGGGNTAEL
jgi:hypothetical protein